MKLFCGRILIALTAAIALVAVSGAAAETIDGYTATAKPSHVRPATNARYTIELTNNSAGRADRAKIGVANDFVVEGSSVSATANGAGDCSASAWVPDGTLIAGGKINVKRANLGGVNTRLCPGATLTVAFSATSATAEGAYVWATELFGGDDVFLLTGAQPTVVVDGTPPTVSVTAHPADLTNATSASFGFTANEVVGFECRLDGGPFSGCSSPTNYSGVGDGSHTFTVRASDGAGNRGEAGYTWTVDTVAPSVTLVQKPSNPSNTPSATFAFEATEPGATFQCRLNSPNFAPCTSGTTYGSLSDGSYSFAVRARDEAGNSGAETIHLWTIDTVAPTPSITQKPDDPSNVESPTFAFSVNEASSFQCKLDGDSYGNCSSPKSYSGLADGRHTFTVRAIDTAGNAGEAGYTWLLETALPIVALAAQPAENPTNSRSITFTLTPSRPKATMECKLDAGEFQACTGVQTYTNLGDGVHSFSARATDHAGTGPPTVYSWAIDATGPTSAVTQRPGDPTNSRSASFAFSASESATFQCKVDDGAFSACASPEAYGELADGRHTFVVKAADTLGNVGPEAHYSWTVETRVPAVVVTAAPPAISNSRTATFAFAADEAATFQCSLDGLGFEPCSSPMSYGALGDGGHALAVRAVDAAGNVGAASYSWTLDATAPETTVESRPRPTTTARSATFTFSASEAAAFQCRLDAGSFRPCASPKTYAGVATGLHRFAVRAVDGSGNADATPAVSKWTIERATGRVARSSLMAPVAGARVTGPPLLRWRRVRGATYYNVQLYRGGRKVLTAWPTRTALQLRGRWRFNGRTEILRPGVYRWYVWPGRGRMDARRYGRLLGASTFVVGGAASRR